jgi:hypothetical protein
MKFLALLLFAGLGICNNAFAFTGYVDDCSGVACCCNGIQCNTTYTVTGSTNTGTTSERKTCATIVLNKPNLIKGNMKLKGNGKSGVVAPAANIKVR